MLSKKRLLKIFGAHVRELRMERGLTQGELSSRISKDFQSIQRVERGEVSPSLFYLYELSVGLEIELKVLLDFTIENKPLRRN